MVYAIGSLNLGSLVTIELIGINLPCIHAIRKLTVETTTTLGIAQSQYVSPKYWMKPIIDSNICYSGKLWLI